MSLSDRLTELEAKQDNLTTRLSNVPQDVPDIHPNISEAYRRRIERLTRTSARSKSRRSPSWSSAEVPMIA